MNRTLVKGDRVRLKVRTLFGWKGTGTVLWQSGDLVTFTSDDVGETVDALRDQVALIRKERKSA